MDDSILTSIKHLVSEIPEEVTAFDTELIMHINSVFMILTQLGIGPTDGFSIADSTSKWSEFIPDGKKLQAVKTFMQIKIKLVFDPPMSAAVLEAMKQMANEYEWRLKEGAEDNRND